MPDVPFGHLLYTWEYCWQVCPCPCCEAWFSLSSSNMSNFIGIFVLRCPCHVWYTSTENCWHFDQTLPRAVHIATLLTFLICHKQVLYSHILILVLFHLHFRMFTRFDFPPLSLSRGRALTIWTFLKKQTWLLLFKKNSKIGKTLYIKNMPNERP